MGGGLMQLVAYGAQDVYLSGNPQITFFKVVYRRHTNFSVEPIQQTWNGAAEFGKTVTCNINRNGDLITNMYVAVLLKSMPSNSTPIQWGYVNRLGHAMIDNVKIEIGGSKIDEQYGEWLNVWYELTHKIGQEKGYAKMIGDIPHLTNVNASGKRGYQMYIPLQFWFNRNNGLALPLIALQYHDVRITLNFKPYDQCINWIGGTKPNFTSLMQESYLLIDYVYLDSEERKRFAQASHEYLIEQLQFTGSESLSLSSNRFRLNFNHPSKYLVWVPKLQLYKNRTQWLAYAFDGDWAAARETYAKLLFISASTLAVVTASGMDDFTVTAPSNAVTAAGDLFSEVSRNSITVAGMELLNKIDARFIANKQPTTGAIAGTEDVVVASVISGSSSSEYLQQLLNSVIITNNALTMEDMTNTIQNLTAMKFDDQSAANAKIFQYSTCNIVNPNNYGNFIDGSDNPVASAKLQLNGHDRFQVRDGHYFNYVQPYQHFSNTPADGINVYSFALKAEDYQPTGTCNFSRIDNATLQVECGLFNSSVDTSKYIGSNTDSSMNIYTVNYNVLRVMSGMAGCAYSN